LVRLGLRFRVGLGFRVKIRLGFMVRGRVRFRDSDRLKSVSVSHVQLKTNFYGSCADRHGHNYTRIIPLKICMSTLHGQFRIHTL
jgi:hypothetical protein